MRISDWSSDVCSSDLRRPRSRPARHRARRPAGGGSSPAGGVADPAFWILPRPPPPRPYNRAANQQRRQSSRPDQREDPSVDKERFELGLKQRKRSEEHTSELQSLMRISYAVFCLKKTNTKNNLLQETTNSI